MRHRHGLRKLNVTGSHRKAMLQALCNALIEHEAINTTLPKAKELRRVIEPLVTLARAGDSVAAKRLAFDRLRNRDSVVKLFADIG
ncbi:MAG: 50S ribosomal protein L17, partial [Betaproteobacteria bacterium AqS2]|nr:50S ribosomal protein L17 [Betaproteobacteria bacterium AqS2]